MPSSHTLSARFPERLSASRSLLRLHRLKATSGRMALIAMLKKEPRPISVSDIQKKLAVGSNVTGGGLDGTSIYRALEVFVGAGLVSRINTGAAHASYELISGRKHHHHVICTACGDMEDVDAAEDCLASRVGKGIVKHSKRFSAVSAHSLEFFGLCKRCAVR